jgi:hypothetical protein
MGARLTILYNPDLGEDSVDHEALGWYEQILSDFQDLHNHHDYLVAQIHLGDLYCSLKGRVGVPQAEALYRGVIEVPEKEIVFDDPRQAEFNLDRIAVAKAPLGRQVDGLGRLIAEPTEEMNLVHREGLLQARAEQIALLRRAAIRALAYKQAEVGFPAVTLARLRHLKQERPDDGLYQQTLQGCIEDFIQNHPALKNGRDATLDELLNVDESVRSLP